MSNWDSKFISMATHVAGWSKDRKTKVGCVVVNPDTHAVLSIGFNGFPRGCDDNCEARHQRPAKYEWTEHAERNAIYNAARTGTSLEGATLYSSLFPCMDCARGIVQCGITRVVSAEPDWNHLRWGASFALTKQLFAETGTRLELV